MSTKPVSISERFNLNKSQHELDFVNILIDRDIPVFIDPYFISQQNNNFSREIYSILKDFFDLVINYIDNGQISHALQLLEHTHEVNDIHFGYSKGTSKGKGNGESYQSDLVFALKRMLKESSAIIRNVEDFAIFVDNIKEDRISDLCANIIKIKLLEYTEQQCDLHGIPMEKRKSEFFWDPTHMCWTQKTCRRLIIDNKPYLLVPREIVSTKYEFSKEVFRDEYVLAFYKKQHIQKGSSLVHLIYKGTKKEQPKVYKKELIEHMYGNGQMLTKEWFHSFSIKNKEVWEEFKNHQIIKYGYISDQVDISQLVDHLKDELIKLPTGRDFFKQYEKLIIGILQLIFFPSLSNPRGQAAINEGRQIIDILFSNRAQSGLFKDLHQRDFPCDDIVVECKNYTEDVKNPEISQIESRFNNRTKKFGFLISRNLSNRKLVFDRCKDSFKDKGYIIVPLDDSDIINLLDLYKEFGFTSYNEYIYKLVDRVRQG